ncbi:MAG: lamin tail domain-containing protein [Sedimentisphaerales bacterium]|nr:lamin tail domain-containing protein [Sedimentisphaerales bacterium]
MCKSGNRSIFVVFVALLTVGSLGPDGGMRALAQDLGDDDEPNVPVSINEIMASNSTAMADSQGQFDDWIEIHNWSDSAVDIGGLYLTDDIEVPAKWQVPTSKPTLTTIAAGGYLLIWMDGDTGDSGLHASFGLDADGDALYLLESDGRTLVDSIEFGGQIPNVSYGRYPEDTADWQFLKVFTPGASNYQAYDGLVGDVEISPAHGFYDEPFEVTMLCGTPDATIYYTTDGSEPAREGSRFPTGKAYSAPFQITRTTCIRAKAIKTGWKSSRIATQTYVFLDLVIRQSASVSGLPGSWAGVNADYAMDTRIVNPNLAEMKEYLKSIPTMSIVTTVDDMFGTTNGIYSHATSRGLSWEKPASLEMIWPDGQEGFQANCGIRMYGDVGRQNAYRKKSFRLLFKGVYGQTSLRYPLFGKDATQEFDQLILRANFNDCYVFGREKSQYMRDEYSRKLQEALGQATSHGTYVHLYIDGAYWGLYNPVERPDQSFTASYFGGDKEDWDCFKTNVPVGDSVGDSWSAMLSAVRQGVQTNEGYQRVQGNNPDGTRNPAYKDYIDLDNYIDYLIVNFFVGNTDWPHKNWYAGMNRIDTSGFKFFCWDTEWVIDLVVGHSLDSSLTENVVNVGNGIAEPYGQLRNNAEFRLLFADHVHRAFFNGGPLYVDPSRPWWDPTYPQGNRPAAAYAALADSIEEAMIAESARWGDVVSSTPYTITQWRAERDYILNTYMVQRPGIVMNQFRNAGLYPSIAAPAFNISGSYQHGGRVMKGSLLSMTGSGTIWYTTDGNDPRLPATVPSGTASANVLVRESAAKRVLVPTADIGQAWKGGQPFDDSAWLPGAGGVGFERSTGYESFIGIDVLDAMYGKNASCYIRIPFSLTAAALQGISNLTLKVRYDDGFVAYINGTEVCRAQADGTPAWNAGASASHSDTDAIVFENFDISSRVATLRQGDNVLAVHGLNQGSTSSDFLLSVELAAAKAQSGSQPAGVAPTALQYGSATALSKSTHVKARVLSGTTWSALNEAVYAAGPVAQSLRISEIMYHPADTGKPTDPNTEYVELTNIGSDTINLNLVKFTNGIDFTFPVFELAPGGYCVVVRDEAAFEAKYGSGRPVAGRYAGNLNNAGERLELLDALGTVIESFRFRDDWFNLTDGMGFSLTARDLQADPNAFTDKSAWRPSAAMGGSPGTDDSGQVPSLGAVVINELLANSQGRDPDWIELHNTTDQAISIGGWFLSDDADDLTKYQIASGASIPAGGYVVFYENRQFGSKADPGCKEPFALSADGETVYLHSGAAGALTGYSEQEKFDASEPGVSLGRYEKSTGSYNFVALSEPTPGAANAVPQVGPVVIHEIMYHPDGLIPEEYVELLNITDAPVKLYDMEKEAPWRFTDDPDNPGIELLFPTDVPVVLAPGEYIVLAKAENLVRDKYDIPVDVRVFSWGVGNLANGAEKVQISRPGDLDGQDERIWMRVDRVVYSDGAHPWSFPGGIDPWPTQADGQGSSLSRIDPAAYGNDPANWRARTPSPGLPNP